jgi:hypothetical protein
VAVNGESVDFGHRSQPGDRLAAYPIYETLDIGPLTRVRPRSLGDSRFVVDINLGGLARLMRLMGLDARCGWDADDAALAEPRILLTCDRGLLKRRNVTHGVFVRSDRPLEQIIEVIRRLDPADRLAPAQSLFALRGRRYRGGQAGHHRSARTTHPPLPRHFPAVPRLRSDLLEGFATPAVGQPRRPESRRDQAG